MRPDLAELEKKMKNRMRDVRAAEKHGLTFHEGDSPEILDDLLSLLEETKSTRLSKNYQNYSYFYISYVDKDTLYQLFKHSIVRAFYVKQQDEILSVTLDAVHNKRAYGLFIGTNQMGYKLKANAFIHYKLIQKFKNEGIEFYNFGGVPSDPSSKGLIFFKTSFGAREQVCAGGRTHHLQSRLFNYLTNAYSRFPDLKIKKIIKKKLVGRNYA
jgi:lipid II:glycine glycyltransferase (peptidoglycan interpeptide bridge formation enzyme)